MRLEHRVTRPARVWFVERALVGDAVDQVAGGGGQGLTRIGGAGMASGIGGEGLDEIAEVVVEPVAAGFRQRRTVIRCCGAGEAVAAAVAGTIFVLSSPTAGAGGCIRRCG